MSSGFEMRADDSHAGRPPWASWVESPSWHRRESKRERESSEEKRTERERDIEREKRTKKERERGASNNCVLVRECAVKRRSVNGKQKEKDRERRDKMKKSKKTKFEFSRESDLNLIMHFWISKNKMQSNAKRNGIDCG